MSDGESQVHDRADDLRLTSYSPSLPYCTPPGGIVKSFSGIMATEDTLKRGHGMRKKRLGAVAALLLGSSLFMVQRVIGQPATLSIEAPPAETTRAERAPAESVLSVPVFITEGEPAVRGEG
jgi:hypothetical protein